MQQRERSGGKKPFRKEGRSESRFDKDGRKKRKKACFFCVVQKNPDYKLFDQLKKFTTERGKIMTKRGSGCCAKHQRALAIQIKRARQMGLLSYVAE